MFSSVEFCLWDAQDDTTNFQRNYSTGEVEVDRLGPHLLPLIGRADWNDCLNLNCFPAVA